MNFCRRLQGVTIYNPSTVHHTCNAFQVDVYAYIERYMELGEDIWVEQGNHLFCEDDEEDVRGATEDVMATVSELAENPHVLIPG